MNQVPAFEDLARRLAPQVLGAVVRRYGNFDLAEDATQEALVAAALQWPRAGVPNNPKGWLITVASRRLTDLLRARKARHAREENVHRWTLQDYASDAKSRADGDDTLTVLFMCCHPELSSASQIALTLRAVGGLTTGEVARALVVSEATVTRRITRAKQTIREHGTTFTLPNAADYDQRLKVVLHVLYLIFTEGYTATAGQFLQRAELASEAIRLTRTVRHTSPTNAEIDGLLALMLLTDARRRARAGPDGDLIPMAEQDRTLWDTAFIEEGVALITAALPFGPVGPYQLQAAIAAIHDEAASDADTDWAQIVLLYELLLKTGDNPIVALNHAVAVAMAQGPAAGLALVAALQTDNRISDDYRLHAVVGHLHRLAGQTSEARAGFEAAAERATNLRQQRYLRNQALQLTDPASA